MRKQVGGFSTLGLLLWVAVAVGQGSSHLEVLKGPGDPLTIYFSGLPADLSTFDGIAVESSVKLEGPYSDMTLTINKGDKSITFPAPAIPTFFRIYCWKLSGGSRIKSVSSNPVAVTIILNGMPTATAS